MPEVDHFLGSSDMPLGKVLADPMDVAKRKVPRARRQPGRLGDPRVRPARGDGLDGERLPEDRRGLQPHLRVLHDPAVPRQQRSRTADDVVREAEQLAAQGILEVNLISQDTVSYGRDLPKGERDSLAGARGARGRCEGPRWVRVFYLYPETIDEAFLDPSRITRVSCRTSTCRSSTRRTRCSRA